MGDWGGQPDSPYTTVGELAIAKSMGPLSEKLKCKFTLALGDNFYDHGVTSSTMSRFNATFENVFKSSSLQTPFYLVAGNHDHIGDVMLQVQYTKFHPRWNFPSLYYTFTETIPGTTSTIQFVMIDTVVLAGNSESTEFNTYPIEPESKFAAQSQWEWIENTLVDSTADYLIVAGHYPVWSIAEHGPTPLLVKRLKPLLEHTKVTAYLCGHDHNEQFIADSSGVDYHVIGAAHVTDPSTSHLNAVPKGSLKWHWSAGKAGFASVSVDTEKLVITHHDQDGAVIYTAPPHAPRTKAPRQD